MTMRAAAAFLCALLLAGCNRQPPRFVPAEADSIGSASADSFAVMVGRSLDLWESGAGGEAASATARLLLGDLRRHPESSLPGRVRTLLDSTGLSGEVAGSGDIAAVNLFARSDPAGGAWPQLFWRHDGSVRAQELDGSGMRLVDLAVKQGSDDEPPAQVALLFMRSGNRGPQPVVLTWRRSAQSWSLLQSLGPDSLGGTGSARFSAGPEGVQLEARTWRIASGFDECGTCPHVVRTRRFAWTDEGFSLRDDQRASSPYATFVALITALRAGDRELALRRLADPSLMDAAERYEWGRATGVWRVAPGSDDAAEEMVFFRGNREAYRVRFAARDGEWLVTDLQQVDRSLE